LKTTISITLKREELSLLEDLNEKYRLDHTFSSRWRQWVFRRAFVAVAREMLKQNGFNLPLAVTLRSETDEEKNERRAQWLPLTIPSVMPAPAETPQEPEGSSCIIRINFSEPPDLFGWQ
jgi:hypothetical protein